MPTQTQGRVWLSDQSEIMQKKNINLGIDESGTSSLHDEKGHLGIQRRRLGNAELQQVWHKPAKSSVRLGITAATKTRELKLSEPRQKLGRAVHQKCQCIHFCVLLQEKKQLAK